MELKGYRLSKINQKEKDKCQMVSLKIWVIEKSDKESDKAKFRKHTIELRYSEENGVGEK